MNKKKTEKINDSKGHTNRLTIIVSKVAVALIKCKNLIILQKKNFLCKKNFKFSKKKKLRTNEVKYHMNYNNKCTINEEKGLNEGRGKEYHLINTIMTNSPFKMEPRRSTNTYIIKNEQRALCALFRFDSLLLFDLWRRK